ncbi:hypothetical protein [Rathayibacter toxicus]|uniref:DUF7882 family protein n=1 Tax=Rathayibacter toxicus TaxID=145458 RepID=UPI001C03B63C|nr:hypothetical protein [Rathayibacter toxicus]QWL29428.1 hypothetical protein E2R34_00705 [Rathayibacter toxicus]
MATLVYGPHNLEIDFEERVLAHLKVAVLSKLRRNESFSLSWVEDASTGHGRSSLWMHPAVPLHFRFAESHQPKLNRAWIEQMLSLASMHGELVILPEPEEQRQDV